MRTHSLILPVLLMMGCSTQPGKPNPSPGTGQEAWHDVRLPGKSLTLYRHLLDAGRPVVYAESEGSASMLRRAVRVEPADIGRIKFSWQVKQLIDAADLTNRDSDDSPVRLILAFDGDHERLSLRNRMIFDLAHAVTGEKPPFATLMYVWDNKAPVESIIPNGRTDRIRKIVVESGSLHVDKWRNYERDIASDYERAFGEAPGSLIAVGFMTDSDNTRSSAKAWYGEVHIITKDGRTF